MGTALHEPALPVAADFVGTWNVRRRIVDHRAGTTMHFAGHATITSTDFKETGQLTLGSVVMAATRAYRLRFNLRDVTVLYPDGSVFICLQWGPSQKVRHDCGADVYLGRFFFVDADTWAEAWRVRGPRKNYASVSHYRRESR